MRKLFKFIVGLFVFLIVVAILGNFAIMFCFGNSGKVEALGISGYKDIYDIYSTCNSGAPSFNDDDIANEVNTNALVNEVKKNELSSLLSDDLVLATLVSGEYVFISEHNLEGGEIASLYAWSIEKGEEFGVADEYITAIDLKFESFIISNVDDDTLRFTYTISADKEDLMTYFNIDGKANKYIDKLIKCDRIYVTASYNANFNSNQISTVDDITYSLNSSSVKKSKDLVNIINHYGNNVLEDIITTNNDYLNKLGNLAVGENNTLALS